MLSANSPKQTVHTYRASVHQAAKLVAALLRVAGVTAGLAESNGNLPPGLTHVTCRLTAKHRDQLRNPTLGNLVWATFTFFTCGESAVMPVARYRVQCELVRCLKKCSPKLSQTKTLRAGHCLKSSVTVILVSEPVTSCSI